MSDHLITSRRNFLIRASAITAAGAAVAVPIVTVADARARASHHLKGLSEAIEQIYPQNTFRLRAHFPDGEYAEPNVKSDRVLVTIMTRKSPTPPPEYRQVFKSWRDADRARLTGQIDQGTMMTVNINAEG